MLEVYKREVELEEQTAGLHEHAVDLWRAVLHQVL